MATLNHVPRQYADLIIICGPPRSGTTWLNRELCKLPTAFQFLPECTLITQQIELYSQTLHYCDPQRLHSYFSNHENLQCYYRTNVARLIDQVATLNQKKNASTLVLKDPCLCLYLKDIKDVLPLHKLVVLIRDPRDVLASMKKVTSKKKQKWSVREAAKEFLNYYIQIEAYQQRADKNNIFLRYEDIVTGKIARLQNFLQLQQSNKNATFTQEDALAVRGSLDISDPFFSELYLQPITSQKVGSYTKILSRLEICYIEYVFSKIMQHWGYWDPNSLMTRIMSLCKMLRNLFK